MESPHKIPQLINTGTETSGQEKPRLALFWRPVRLSLGRRCKILSKSEFVQIQKYPDK
jgi:hypothetical protein